jgi:hypothetical protein
MVDARERGRGVGRWSFLPRLLWEGGCTEYEALCRSCVSALCRLLARWRNWARYEGTIVRDTCQPMLDVTACEPYTASWKRCLGIGLDEFTVPDDQSRTIAHGRKLAQPFPVRIVVILYTT